MRILCYGDSNTWGYVPNIDGYSKTATINQYNKEDCWWFCLTKNNTVFVDGLCGRCVAHENKWLENRNALKTIDNDLKPYKNLDYIIVQLGTNDCKSEYNNTPKQIANNLEVLLKRIKEKTAAKIIILGPAIIKENNAITQKFYVGAQKKSGKLNVFYKNLAQKMGCKFVCGIDLEVGDDGEHLTKKGHKQLKEKIEQIISQ